MSKIYINWTIKNVDNIGISSDKKIYRLPYEYMGRYYTLKEIKPHNHMGSEYYRIHKKRYTKKRINELSVKLKRTKIIELYESDDLPF